jgi:hypothetical protein
MSDDAKVLCALMFVLLLVSAIAWPIAWYRSAVVGEAMKNGYEQQSLPGVEGPHWVKRGKQ